MTVTAKKRRTSNTERPTSKGTNTTKSAATKGATGSASANDQVVQIPLDKLHDHPGNPEPTEQEILQMMSWLIDVGQDEPITVRPLPEPLGHYEVLAGKTRKAAASRLGWDALDARVRRDLEDDFNAMSFAARNNSERRTEGDLRKAHWLRYQVDQLGMTVADAATTLDMAQSTASNLMAVADLCEKHDYWKQLVISGEIQAGLLRPLKKYRDCKPVMKLMQKLHADSARCGAKESWGREEHITNWGTRDAIAWTIESELLTNTRALREADMFGEESGYHIPRFPANKLKAASLKKLKVASIPVPGDKQDRMAERCFDTKAWRVLQDAAKNSKAKKAADQSSKGATGSASAKRELTPSEQKQRDVDRARQLKDRITAWRHAWLKDLVAARLDKHPLIVARMRAWLQSEPFSGIAAGDLSLCTKTIQLAGAKAPGYQDARQTWNAVATLSTEKIEDLSRELIRSILTHEDRDKKYPRFDFDHVESLALMAKIDVAKEWSALQRSNKKGVEFETFFLLHDKAQLEKLAKELKVNIHDLSTKKQLVGRLIGQPRALPLPKSIAVLKGSKTRGRT
jgi:ParB/RepB/Spo0J family partition protein